MLVLAKDGVAVKYGLRQKPQILALNGGAGGSRGFLEGLGGPCSYHAGLVSWTVGGVFPGLESSEWCLVRGGKGDGGKGWLCFLPDLVPS